MKWNKYTLTTTTEAEDLISSMMMDAEDEKREFQKYFLDFQKKREIVCNNLDMIK